MQAAVDLCYRSRQRVEAATGAVDDLKAKLDKAQQELAGAKQNYAADWIAVRELAGTYAWQHVNELAAVGACVSAASQVTVGIGCFAGNIVRQRLRLSRSDDHDLSARQPIRKVPLSSPPPSAAALGSSDAWPGSTQPAAEPSERTISGVIVPPRPPVIHYDSFESGVSRKYVPTHITVSDFMRRDRNHNATSCSACVGTHERRLAS